MPRWLPIACASLAMLAPMSAPAPAQSTLSASDRSAAFSAAGYSRRGGQWRSDCDDPGTASYMPASIETVSDVNGDGQPEVVIREDSSYCYGNTGTGFALVSRQADGTWKLMTSGQGMPSFLDTRGEGGWPDIEIGGPGFCFPVERWNGREYAVHRSQYEGKPCRR